MIGLVADDLTGASDAGVQFTRRGLYARVLFDVARPLAHAGLDALAIDTDSRALSPDEAYARVHHVADALRMLQPRHVYKKIDSTLRGNVGVEIDALMDAFDAPLAIVAPGLPALGRTTRAGTHFVRGVPVAETETARDPRAPVHESNIVRLLQAQSRRAAALVRLECVVDGAPAVRRRIDAHTAHTVSLIVCDAETDEHLRTIVDSIVDRTDVVWVGSAGLAEQLAKSIAPATSCRARAPLQSAGGPILLVCGSLSQTTQRQARAFAALPDVCIVYADASALADQPGACRAETERCRQAVETALDNGMDCALIVVARPVRSAGAAQRIASALGEIGAAAVRAHRLGGLILTGGDTARAVCHTLGATGVDLYGEVEPGVPIGRLIGAVELPAVTKAGAFGSDEALVRVRQCLRELAQKGATTR
jgi:D-threonate/D-erythronate kinase